MSLEDFDSWPQQAKNDYYASLQAKRKAKPQAQPKVKEQKRDEVERPARRALPAPDPEFHMELKEAKAFARRKVIRDYYVAQFKAGEDIEEMSDAAQAWFQQMLDKQEAKEKAKKTGTCWFITVNPKDGIALKQLHAAIQKMCKKKYVDTTQTRWCYEVTDKLERAPHAHIIVHLTEEKSLSIVKREFGNTFKNLVGNPQHVDVKTNFSTEDQARRERYIRGTKKKPEANRKHQEYCLPWREDYGIKAIYSHADVEVPDNA